MNTIEITGAILLIWSPSSLSQHAADRDQEERQHGCYGSSTSAVRYVP
jgi:hypothetical protein